MMAVLIIASPGSALGSGSPMEVTAEFDWICFAIEGDEYRYEHCMSLDAAKGFVELLSDWIAVKERSVMLDEDALGEQPTADEENVPGEETGPIQWLATIMTVNGDLIDQAIDQCGPAAVASFFINAGWGIAAVYDVPMEEITGRE